jgi:protein ImuB
MPVICVFVPSFALVVASGEAAPERGAPALVVDKLERGRIVDRSAAAAALGAQIGMTLLQAQAVAHDARVFVDDPSRRLRLWNEALDALDAATPLIEDAAPGTAFLEMHGIEGDPARWFAVVREALASFGWPVRLGLAHNRFVARAAAETADETALDAATAQAFLAPLALDLVAPPDGMREQLRLLGVTTLGELAALPHGPFVRRFGIDGARRHALARGIDDEPLVPRTRAMRLERTLFGAGDATSEEQVLFALRTLVGHVVDDLVLAGKRCGRLVLGLECEDGDTHELVARSAQPTAQPTTLFELLRARLEGVVLRSSVVGIRLVAHDFEDGGVPLALFSGNDPDPEALGLVVARLEAALGEGAARRPRIVEHARIEGRTAYDPFAIAVLAAPTWASAFTAQRSALPDVLPLQYRARVPYEVDVALDDGAPRFVGTPPQAVVDLAGPFRVNEGWWHACVPAANARRIARDEYDVLLEDGALYRIACADRTWYVCGAYD